MDKRFNQHLEGIENYIPLVLILTVGKAGLEEPLTTRYG